MSGKIDDAEIGRGGRSSSGAKGLSENQLVLLLVALLVAIAPGVVSIIQANVQGGEIAALKEELESTRGVVAELQASLATAQQVALSLGATVAGLEDDIGSLNGTALKNLFEELNETATTYKEGFESAGNVASRLESSEINPIVANVFDMFPRSREGFQRPNNVFVHGYCGTSVSNLGFRPYDLFNTNKRSYVGYFLAASSLGENPQSSRGSDCCDTFNYDYAVPSRSIFLHPGAGDIDRTAVVRYQAPISGTAIISAKFTQLGYGITSVDVVIEAAGNELTTFGPQVLRPNQVSVFTVNEEVMLRKGDYVFFSVDRYDGYGGDGTSLEAEVKLIPFT